MSKTNRDRVCVSDSHGKLLKEKYNKEGAPLELNMTDRKEAFLMAAALGCNAPRDEIENLDNAGLALLTTFKTGDRAILASVLLGDMTSDNGTIEQNANMDSIIDYAEKCADKGFDILWEFIEDAKGDENLLERRLLKQMDLWYQDNVKD